MRMREILLPVLSVTSLAAVALLSDSYEAGANEKNAIGISGGESGSVVGAVRTPATGQIVLEHRKEARQLKATRNQDAIVGPLSDYVDAVENYLKRIQELKVTAAQEPDKWSRLLQPLPFDAKDMVLVDRNRALDDASLILFEISDSLEKMVRYAPPKNIMLFMRNPSSGALGVVSRVAEKWKKFKEIVGNDKELEQKAFARLVFSVTRFLEERNKAPQRNLKG